VLSILYFALMALILIDSSRALAEANRFRARIVASTLAENGAELAAWQMTSLTSRTVTDDDEQGRIWGDRKMTGNRDQFENQFEINAEGTAIGVLTQTASVRVQGRVEGTVIKIDYTMHSQ
jgi:hypothetical protein